MCTDDTTADRAETVLHWQRKAAALDFLLSHRRWLADQQPRLQLLYDEEVLERIGEAMQAEKDERTGVGKP